MEKPHKKLNVWKSAIELVLGTYELTRLFPETEKYNLTSQMKRAAVSVASNIAEGAARKSKKEFAQFLRMAQGSISELDTQLEIAKLLGFAPQEKVASIDVLMERTDKMLSGLIRHQSPHS